MNLKELIEKRNAKIEEMKAICEKAKEGEEVRAMDPDELKAFNDLKAEVDALKETIDAMGQMPDAETVVEDVPEDKTDEETRALDDFIRSQAGVVNTRATNLAYGDNGAIVPTSIDSAIVKRVEELSPLYANASKYNVKGTLELPAEDDTTDAVTMAYADDFTELESHVAKYSSVELKGFTYGALALIGKKLVNNTNFDLTTEVIDQMARKKRAFIEHEAFNPTSGKVAGLAGITRKVTTASATKVTADEVIDLKNAIEDVYQQNAIFVMSHDTRTALQKLKDSNGRYLLQDDISSPFGTTLLGKPVYTSSEVSDLGAGKDAIFYGDFSCVAIKEGENGEAQVLNEKYATMHAIGVVLWGEIDIAIRDKQGIAKLTCAAA